MNGPDEFDDIALEIWPSLSALVLRPAGVVVLDDRMRGEGRVCVGAAAVLKLAAVASVLRVL